MARRSTGFGISSEKLERLKHVLETTKKGESDTSSEAAVEPLAPGEEDEPVIAATPIEEATPTFENFQAYATSRLEEREGSAPSLSELYDDYLSHTDTNNQLSPERFTQELEKQGFVVQRIAGRSRVLGAAIVASNPESKEVIDAELAPSATETAEVKKETKKIAEAAAAPSVAATEWIIDSLVAQNKFDTTAAPFIEQLRSQGIEIDTAKIEAASKRIEAAKLRTPASGKEKREPQRLSTLVPELFQTDPEFKALLDDLRSAIRNPNASTPMEKYPVRSGNGPLSRKATEARQAINQKIGVDVFPLPAAQTIELGTSIPEAGLLSAAVAGYVYQKTGVPIEFGDLNWLTIYVGTWLCVSAPNLHLKSAILEETLNTGSAVKGTIRGVGRSPLGLATAALATYMVAGTAENIVGKTLESGTYINKAERPVTDLVEALGADNTSIWRNFATIAGLKTELVVITETNDPTLIESWKQKLIAAGMPQAEVNQLTLGKSGGKGYGKRARTKSVLFLGKHLDVYKAENKGDFILTLAQINTARTAAGLDALTSLEDANGTSLSEHISKVIDEYIQNRISVSTKVTEKTREIGELLPKLKASTTTREAMLRGVRGDAPPDARELIRLKQELIALADEKDKLYQDLLRKIQGSVSALNSAAQNIDEGINVGELPADKGVDIRSFVSKLDFSDIETKMAQDRSYFGWDDEAQKIIVETVVKKLEGIMTPQDARSYAPTIATIERGAFTAFGFSILFLVMIARLRGTAREGRRQNAELLFDEKNVYDDLDYCVVKITDFLNNNLPDNFPQSINFDKETVLFALLQFAQSEESVLREKPSMAEEEARRWSEYDGLAETAILGTKDAVSLPLERLAATTGTAIAGIFERAPTSQRREQVRALQTVIQDLENDAGTRAKFLNALGINFSVANRAKADIDEAIASGDAYALKQVVNRYEAETAQMGMSIEKAKAEELKMRIATIEHVLKVLWSKHPTKEQLQLVEAIDQASAGYIRVFLESGTDVDLFNLPAENIPEQVARFVTLAAELSKELSEANTELITTEASMADNYRKIRQGGKYPADVVFNAKSMIFPSFLKKAEDKGSPAPTARYVSALMATITERLDLTTTFDLKERLELLGNLVKQKIENLVTAINSEIDKPDERYVIDVTLSKSNLKLELSIKRAGQNVGDTIVLPSQLLSKATANEDVTDLIETYFDRALTETITRRVVRDRAALDAGITADSLRHKIEPIKLNEIESTELRSILKEQFKLTQENPRINKILKNVSVNAGLSEKDARAIRDGLFSPEKGREDVETVTALLEEIAASNLVTTHDITYDPKTNSLYYKKKGGFSVSKPALFAKQVKMSELIKNGGLRHLETLTR